MAERQGPLHRRVGEGDTLLQVCPGRGVFALEKQGAPERVMGLQAGHGCSLALGQPVELFAQLPCRRQDAPSEIEPT
jgi:hypothetical protein